MCKNSVHLHNVWIGMTRIGLVKAGWRASAGFGALGQGRPCRQAGEPRPVPRCTRRQSTADLVPRAKGGMFGIFASSHLRVFGPKTQMPRAKMPSSRGRLAPRRRVLHHPLGFGGTCLLRGPLSRPAGTPGFEPGHRFDVYAASNLLCGKQLQSRQVPGGSRVSRRSGHGFCGEPVARGL